MEKNSKTVYPDKRPPTSWTGSGTGQDTIRDPRVSSGWVPTKYKSVVSFGGRPSLVWPVQGNDLD